MHSAVMQRDGTGSGGAWAGQQVSLLRVGRAQHGKGSPWGQHTLPENTASRHSEYHKMKECEKLAAAGRSL